MSYLVLARKWRPQTFEDMTGQEHVVRTVANAIKQNRVSHAYLFSGPRGVGKTTAARLLAKALNCEKGPTAEPCGQCRPCIEIAQGTSIDVAEIDGASNNGVENVREIRENAKYLPQRDRHKIYIIDEVHMLTQAAFNALLKTLEEPPGHVKFIFATTEPHKLPDTILSRCQRHNFRRIPAARMLARLKEICQKEKATISDRALSMVVQQSDGGMRDALSMLDQIFSAYGLKVSDEEASEAIGAIDRGVVHELVDALIDHDPAKILVRLDDLFNRGADFRRLAEDIATLVRNVFVALAVGQPPAELSETDRAAISASAKRTNASALTRMFDIVIAAGIEMTKGSPPKLTLEMALLKAVALAPGASIPELVARVEKLASGSGSAQEERASGSAQQRTGASGGRSQPSNFRS
jgi:DNA polymerase III subunit gamma/tau